VFFDCHCWLLIYCSFVHNGDDTPWVSLHDISHQVCYCTLNGGAEIPPKLLLIIGTSFYYAIEIVLKIQEFFKSAQGPVFYLNIDIWIITFFWLIRVSNPQVISKSQRELVYVTLCFVFWFLLLFCVLEMILNRQEEERNVKWIGHILGRNCLQRHVLEGKMEGTMKWWEEEIEDVSSYRMNLRKRDGNGNWKRKR
jgi:hypothetical protein